MIKFKQKMYVTPWPHQELTDDMKFKADPELVKKYGEVEPDIETLHRYDRQYEKTMYKKEIKDLIKDINDGHLYDDGPAGGSTHFLSEFTRLGKHITMSKKINREDRLNYRIYPPEVENGRYIQKVVLVNCIGHRIDSKTYSE